MRVVRGLIDNINEPITVMLKDSVSDALDKMLENDFSQLPVIDEQKKPIGFVTYKSITRTLMHRGTSIGNLNIIDVYEEIKKAQVATTEDELSDLLNHLRDTSAILIVDSDEKLIGIVTTYDSTEYFRTQSEDMLNVQDIETTIKDLIRAVFQQKEEEEDNIELRNAIGTVTKINPVTKKEYGKALANYLALSEGGKLNQSYLEQSYDNCLILNKEIKPFSDLTLHDYVAILLHKDQQKHFKNIFNIPQHEIKKLLDDVRETRNDLAHFRRITPTQRDQLIYCKRILDGIVWPEIEEVETTVVMENQSTNLVRNLAPALNILSEAMQKIYTVGESEGGGRYAALADWLQSRSGEVQKIELTFQDVENIIENELPPSAYKHRAWWSNDTVGHTRSQQWLDAGWRRSALNMSARRVTFSRIRERELAYISFFSKLIEKFNEVPDFEMRNVSPDGTSWIVIQRVPRPGPGYGAFTCSFSRGRKMRIELYLDLPGGGPKTKKVFDKLFAEKGAYEKELGTLEWERLDHRGASRIARYRDGHVEDDENHPALIEWAARTMIDFYRTFAKPAENAILQELAE